MSSTTKAAWAFLTVTVLLVAGGIGYVGWASGQAEHDLVGRQARAAQAVRVFELANGQGETSGDSGAGSESGSGSGEQIESERIDVDPGEVVVIHRVPGQDYGRLAVRHVDGTRTLYTRRCVRVHVATGRGVCVSQKGSGLTTTFSAEFFELSPSAGVRLVNPGGYAVSLPSRARLSPSGRVVAVTSFVSGTNYADIGSAVETETLVIIDQIDKRGELIGLAQFELISVSGDRSAAGGQYWGPTFVNDNEFWVTGYVDDQPEIFRGEIENRTLTETGWVGSCPSLSPDRSTLVFKEARDDGSFKLVAVDLASGERWALGETGSVDDQVEWLDDDTVLYALHSADSQGGDVEPGFDIWSVDIAPGSVPELFLPAADSPAVHRASE